MYDPEVGVGADATNTHQASQGVWSQICAPKVNLGKLCQFGQKKDLMGKNYVQRSMSVYCVPWFACQQTIIGLYVPRLHPILSIKNWSKSKKNMTGENWMVKLTPTAVQRTAL